MFMPLYLKKVGNQILAHVLQERALLANVGNCHAGDHLLNGVSFEAV
jgi:hypothetical protein